MRLLYAIAFVGLAGCSFGARAEDPVVRPAMKWDFHPEAELWTAASLSALEGSPLVAMVPDDIGDWCPAYPEAGVDQRALFWTGLLSALAEYESTWNPEVVGAGRYFGLVQISPATARFYGCAATSGEALLDGPANLQCALTIWSVTVPRDGVVSAGRGGVAADWGPMTVASRRAAMQEWTAGQSYCGG